MKFVASCADLSAALKAVAKAVGSGKQHQVLSGVLLTAEADAVRLTTYDLETGISITIPAAVEAPGAACPPHRLLADLVGRLDGSGPLTVALDGQSLKLATTSGSYSLQSHEAEDFPTLPVITAEPSDLIDLGPAIAAVTTAASNDAAKALLQGVHLHAAGGVLTLEATDGHRLAIRQLNWDGTLNLVLPARLLRLCHGPLSIAADDTYANLQLAGGAQIICRLLQGTYPQVQSLIPQDFKHICQFDRDDLIVAIQRAAIVSGNGIIKLTAKSVAAESEGSGGKETIVGNGTLPTLAMNASYILDALQGLDGDEVVISANTATTPVVVRPLDDLSQTGLIMPVHIRNES